MSQSISHPAPQNISKENSYSSSVVKENCRITVIALAIFAGIVVLGLTIAFF